MEVKGIREKLKSLFEENGLEIFEGEEDEILDLDSLRLVALYVAIEDEFNFEIPDEYLTRTTLTSFNDFTDMVNLCLINK